MEKIPFIKHGYWHKSAFSLGSTPEYLHGYCYLQEAASQIPAEILDAKPDEIVLDMAAAPGSKLTQIAAMMKNEGVLIGIDSDERRLTATRNNMARLGILNAILYTLDGHDVRSLHQEFDKILLDAPCSGNYCIDKDYFEKRTVADFENRSKLQRELLKAAFSVLKLHGTLVYSTCSLEPEENELVIDWAIKELGAVVQPITLSIGDPGITHAIGLEFHPTVAKCKRLWPHKTGTQGFFVAKLTTRS
jgi:NOL1/NOP2/sun family putative RNA methylase